MVGGLPKKLLLPRKEVIQPHLPVRLPCYDFTPLALHTFDASPHEGWAGGFQVGEPHRHVEDLRTGKWRALYATFTSRDGRYFFQGYNFAGEVDSRPYMNDPEQPGEETCLTGSSELA